MPLFLVPFIILAAGNTRMHKHQADAAMMEAETHRAQYELQVREYNDKHPQTIKRAQPAYTVTKH